MSANVTLLGAPIVRRAMRSHHSPLSRSTTWLTPPAILAALGEFDLDPCACPMPRPWATAKIMWTRDDGPLLRPWPAGARVWLNPPYGPPQTFRAFTHRMVAHGTGTALLSASTETEIFFNVVWNAATAVLFLRGPRLIFFRQNGMPGRFTAGVGSALVAYGRPDAAALSECGLAGHFVRLQSP